MRLPFRFQLRHLLLVCPFVLLAPVWLTGKASYWGTPSMQFIPWWWRTWQTIRLGELPLWNPLLGMGAPLLANYQSALFYPPTWIYFGLAAVGGLPLMAWGQAVMMALHLAWAGWGMGLLIRRLGKSELAQTVGGLAFSLSGYLVARAHFLSINAAVAWLPWIMLAAYDLAQEPRRKRGPLWLAFVLGMQWLAGHAQLAWYTLLLAAAWTAFWAWRAGGWPQLCRAALAFGGAGLLAFALAAVQLIPTGEYLLNSQRAAQVDFAQAAAYSFWPWRLLGLLAPNFFGNPAYGSYVGYGNYWEDAIYIGLLPLFLALAALWSMRRARKERPLLIFLIVLGFISLLLALGDNTPLFALLYKYVPSFALFQSPTRFSIWLVFALALLAAFGAEAWRAPSGRGLYWARLAPAAAAALAVFSVIAVLLLDRGAPFAWAMLSMGLIAAGAGWLNLHAPGRKGAGTARWARLVCLLLAVDVLYAGWGLNPGVDLVFYKEGSSPSTLLSQQVGDGRLYIPEQDERELKFERLFRFDSFYSVAPGAMRASLLPNLPLLDGLASANNFDPLVPARYRHWIDALEVAPAERQEAMLAAMNVTVIERVLPDGGVAFEPRPALPRARWVNCAQPVADAAEALALAVAPGYSPSETVLVEISAPLDGPLCGAGPAGSLDLVASSPNRVQLQVDAPGGGWLVLADTWYPGWTAVSDSKELPVYPADGVFRAVQLKPGEYQIDFVYQPASFMIGLALSALAWAGWVFFRLARPELR